MFHNNDGLQSTYKQQDLAPYNQIILFNLHTYEQINYHVQQLNQREAILLNQVQIMKQLLQNMANDIQSAINSAINRQFDLIIEKVHKIWKQANSFKKNEACPVEGCNHKYSSRIALRAHMKRKHQRKELQNAQFKP